MKDWKFKLNQEVEDKLFNCRILCDGDEEFSKRMRADITGDITIYYFDGVPKFYSKTEFYNNSFGWKVVDF
jgi:hypothetical protein